MIRNYRHPKSISNIIRFTATQVYICIHTRKYMRQHTHITTSSFIRFISKQYICLFLTHFPTHKHSLTHAHYRQTLNHPPSLAAASGVVFAWTCCVCTPPFREKAKWARTTNVCDEELFILCMPSQSHTMCKNSYTLGMRLGLCSIVKWQRDIAGDSQTRIELWSCSGSHQHLYIVECAAAASATRGFDK